MNAKVTSAAIKFFSITIGFLINFYLASLLSKNDFGIYSAMVSLLSICLVFSNMGLSLSVIDLFPKAQTKENLKYLQRKIFLYSISSSIIVGTVASIYAMKTNIISSETNHLIPITAVIVIVFFQNAHSINIAALRSLQSFRLALTMESILFNVVLIVSIYYLFVNYTLALYMPFLLAASTAFMLSYIFSLIKIAKFQDNITNNSKRLDLNLTNLVPFMLLGLAEIITTNLDVLLVREFFGNEHTADYFLAKKLLIAFTFFWFIYNFIYTPKLSKLFTNKYQVDKNAVTQILRLKWPVLFISTLCMFIANIFFDNIVLFFNLENYLGAKPYVALFSLFAFIHILTGPVVSFLNVTGLSSYSFKVVSFGAIIFVVSFYPLQHFFGVIGVLIALNLSLLAWKVLGIYIIRKATGFNLLIGSYIGE